MNQALLMLYFQSLRNAFLMRLRRLRQPKYLIAALLGVAWMSSILVPLAFGRGMRAPLGNLVEMKSALSALLLVILFYTGWIQAELRGGLSLDENEANWLFSAPLRRRQLLLYHFLKPQLGLLLISAGLAIPVASLFRQGYLNAWVTVYLVWNFILLHHLAVGLLYHSLKRRPLAQMIWRALTSLLLLLAMGAFALAIWESKTSVISVSETVGAKCLIPVSKAASALTAPLLESTLKGYLQACLPLVLTAVVFLLWTLCCRLPWQELTYDQIKRKSDRLAAIRLGQGWRRQPKTIRQNQPLFELSPTGSATTAFFWSWGIRSGGRSAIAFRALILVSSLTLLGLGFLTIDPALVHQKRLDLIAGGTALYVGIIIPILFIVPSKISQQLYADLTHLDLIFTLPIRAAQFLKGVMLGPILSALCYAWGVLLAVAILLWHRASLPQMTPTVILSGWLGASLLVAVILPTFTALQMLMVLFFPGWQPRAKSGQMDNIGIGLLFLIALLISIFVNFGLASLICWGGYKLLIGAISLPMGILLGCVVCSILIGLEGWIIFRWMCRAFYRYDPSERTSGVRKKR
jgi:ABC-2 type transport system permease protein